MISKKNKALVAGILAAGMTATAVIPSFASAATEYATENKANESYATMFSSLYDDVVTNGVQNGYLSSQTNGESFGIPYHAVETMVVEAPDYGHETTSEAMSYIVWMASMHDVLVKKGVISGSNDLKKAWNTLEAIIPGWSKASGRTDIEYETIWTQQRLKADAANEEDLPSSYPAKQVEGAGAEAINPLYESFKGTYGSDKGYYLMHWLADVDDWYGFGGGTPGAGTGKFTFINTFQRGEQESCFETVPHPCIEELVYGNKDSGIKGIFNGSNVPEQYAFTNAPDAEDRAIQAVYFANRYEVDTGDVSALAGKMGDQCRNDMFDKYYKKIGCQDIHTESSGLESQHFLMAWYTSWGGALDTFYGGHYDWAWQIGCSHSHQFYQNPLAAYGLIYDTKLNAGMASGDVATSDYKKSLQRQIEMYQWLQSVDGPFAGGCTNSYRGRYEKYPDGYPTFYDMVYVPHPVYADPGSNHWIGNQVWSTQRLAELYYDVCVNGDKATDIKFGGLDLKTALEKLLERWIGWFEENTHFNYTDKDGNKFDYCIPSSLDWGKDDTDYSVAPDTWSKTYSESANSKLKCTITGYGQGDIGCVSSLCNTLIYYAAANKVDSKYATEEGSTVAEKGLYLANRLLSAQYNKGRDDIGIAFKDHNGSLKRVFTEPVYIPSTYTGTMPDGSKLGQNATFSSIRESYKNDKMYQEAEAYQNGKDMNGFTVKDNNGDGKINIEDYEFKLHRFWHMGDAIMAYGGMALLYPDVKPIADTDPDPSSSTGEDEDGLWGDANCDGQVNMADAVLIMQSIGNPDKYGKGATEGITDKGEKNGDVENNGDGITNKDALKIQKYKLNLITEAEFKAK
ncbi:MAG: cellulose 1,4-beta-cellobiosidase [Ruminococcus sp.]|nr:cellulose 1,4-beta-cellobiosidase [Ruminococcus sp.]